MSENRLVGRILAWLLLLMSVALAIKGYASYQRNLAAFSRATRSEPVKVENVQDFLAGLDSEKSRSAGSLSFGVDESGFARPGTLWEVGRSAFLLALALFCLGVGLWIWSRRVSARKFEGVEGDQPAPLHES